MRYLNGLSRSGWVLIGLVAGLIIAPAAAVAATVMILHGANGPAVNATNANQLLTAEAPPSTWVSEYGFNDVAGRCSNLPVVSRTRGFIVRQVNIDVFGGGTAGGNTTVFIYDAPGCATSKTVGEVDVSNANFVYPFNPGIALPPGGQVSIFYNGPSPQVRVQVLGYTVPRSDATATPVLLCAAAPGACVG
jgi:hypothetical protein